MPTHSCKHSKTQSRQTNSNLSPLIIKNPVNTNFPLQQNRSLPPQLRQTPFESVSIELPPAYLTYKMCVHSSPTLAGDTSFPGTAASVPLNPFARVNAGNLFGHEHNEYISMQMKNFSSFVPAIMH